MKQGEGSLTEGATRVALRRYRVRDEVLLSALQFFRQSERHVFFHSLQLARRARCAAGQVGHDTLHQDFRCRGAGGDADPVGSLDPVGVDLFCLVDQVGRGAEQFGHFA